MSNSNYSIGLQQMNESAEIQSAFENRLAAGLV